MLDPPEPFQNVNLLCPLNVQTPCMSFSGVLFYEHHLAIFLKCQIETDPDWGPSEALKAEMMISFKYLEACIENMQDEQKGTFECSLVEGAAMGLLKSGYPISQKLFEKMGHLKYSMGF